MKLNNSKKIKQININKNPKNIDHFWDDCMKEEPFLSNISFRKVSLKKASNEDSINNNYKNKIYEQNKTGIINNCYNNLCEKIPNLSKEKQNNISKKLKIKNSIKRSLLLYSYGVEVQKANKANISQNKIHKEQEELKLCTWRPKINNYKKINKMNKIKIIKNKSDKNMNKKEIDININDECTFKPKINLNSKIKIKKIFNRSKSMILYTDRENSSFIMRYKKARDEHIIKRLKRLSEKDDSYNTSIKLLTSRAIDESYKNSLNVNTNIQIYDKMSKRDKYKSNRIFNLSESNNNNNHNILNSYSNNNFIIPDTHKSKKYYVGLLKKQLRLIDLEI
jgi:hypothetical protein